MFQLSSLANAVNQAGYWARIRSDGPQCTPLEYSGALSDMCGARVYLKCEHQQKTGSFKFRGAYNKLMMLKPEQRAQGVVAASTGNHGMGVAYAAQLLDISASIYVPENTSAMKRAAIERLGARLETVPGDCLQAELRAREQADLSHRVFVSPYNDLDVMAGQGTVALEIAQQLPSVDAVYVSVGGGGLIGGMGSYLKHNLPNVAIVACWPETATTMKTCLDQGRIHVVEEQPTLSDATAGGLEENSVTFPVCQQVIDHQVLVSEAAIAEAMGLLAREERWIVEGAAGVALAACLHDAWQRPGQNLVVVVCGRNIALEKFLSVVATAPVSSTYIQGNS